MRLKRLKGFLKSKNGYLATQARDLGRVKMMEKGVFEFQMSKMNSCG